MFFMLSVEKSRHKSQAAYGEYRIMERPSLQSLRTDAHNLKSSSV